MKKHLLTVVLFLFASSQIMGQQPEQLTVHLNKKWFIAGENMWFSVFCDAGEMEQPSQILHWEIVNRSGKVLVHHQLPINGGFARGDYYIPPDWREDYYMLRIYTMWNLNFSPQQIVSVPLSIYNIGENPPTPEGLAEAPPFIAYQESEMLNVAESNFLRRSQVQLSGQLRLKDGSAYQGPVSIIVGPERSTYLGNGKFGLNDSYPITYEAQFEPEQQLTLRANMFDELFQRKMNSTFLAVYVVESQQFQFTVAEEGYVEANLEGFYGKATVQLYDRAATENYIPKIDFIEPYSFIKEAPALPDARPRRTAMVQDGLTAFKARLEYEQLFGLPFLAPAPQVLPMENNLTADKSYVLKEYIPFDDLESFVIEAMPNVKVQPVLNEKTLEKLEEFEREVAPGILQNLDNAKDLETTQNFLNEVLPDYRRRLENQKTISLLEEESNTRFLGPPMFLIDNYMSFDPSTIFAVNWKDVERIDLFTLNRNLGQTFGPLGFNGVFAMYTRRTRAPEVIFSDPHNVPFMGLYQPRAFESTVQQVDGRVPDFREVIYWENGLQADQDGNFSLSFPHSDDLGRFLVQAVYPDTDGSLRTEYLYYEVVFEGK